MKRVVFTVFIGKWRGGNLYLGLCDFRGIFFIITFERFVLFRGKVGFFDI